MEQAILTSLIGLLITALVWLWRDNTARARDNEKKLEGIESRLQNVELRCPGIMECEKRFGGLTEERLKELLDAYFNKFELRLINEGLIPPKREKKTVQRSSVGE